MELASRKLKVYKPEGTFVRSFKTDTQADHISLIGKNPVLTLTYFNSFNSYLSINNPEGDTLRTAFPFPKGTFPIGLRHISGNLTKYNSGGILVNEPASSTVYSLDKELNLKSKYRFVATYDLWPEERRHELNAYFEKLATGNLTFLSKYYEESESYFFFNLNAKKSDDRLFTIVPRIGYFDIEKGKSYLSKSDDFLLKLKGPIAADGDIFYAYISKMELSKLVKADENWEKNFSSFPEIKFIDKSDFDTPILLKFKVK